jgi:TetR/AcrR family transcriptional regulator
MDLLGSKAARDTRIRTSNTGLILDAALAIFSTYGFRGATVDQIAARAGMSKPNLLYYFRRKQDIYVALLERTLADWLAPLSRLRADGDPLSEIAGYIREKLRMSRENPQASRLFANELLHGAPAISGFLSGPLKDLVDDKARVIRTWIAQGKIAPIEPHHLIFSLWAMTQTYADFDIQIRAILGESETHFADAEETILSLVLNGLKPRGPGSMERKSP